MEPTSDTYMDCFDSNPDLSPSKTPPTSRRIVSFYPTTAGSSALWPDDLPLGTDAISYPQGHQNQQLGSVTGLHAWIIEARSPLIAAAFESSVSGKRLHLDSLDSGTVLPFVRFLYTGYYASHGDWEDVPTSVWLHCRMYYLGHLYDLVDLKSQAYVNVLRQCEFGCSSPCMPIDLCPAIDFVYRHLSGHDAISDALVQYCVTRCLSHKLHENAEFKNVAFFVRAFHQDLTKACRDRDYEDESAAIIIQLPYMHYAPATYASTEDPPISRFEDVVHHYHSTDRFDEISPKKRQRVTFDERQTSPTKVLKLQESTKQPVSRLALRPAPENLASLNFENQSRLRQQIIQQLQQQQQEQEQLQQANANPQMIARLQQQQHIVRQQMIQQAHAMGIPPQQIQQIMAAQQDQQASKNNQQQINPVQLPARLQQQQMQEHKAKLLEVHDANEMRQPQTIIPSRQQAVPLRPTSAGEIFTTAQITMDHLTEDQKVQMRNDAMRNMSEQQLQQASARKQDPLFQYIYEKLEQEAMNESMLAQAAGGQQQKVGLPLCPALGRPIPATTYIMKKLPTHPLFPSCGKVLDENVDRKDENLPIWRRRDIAGTKSGLSQALETLRGQEEQSQGDQSVESAQKQGSPALTLPEERNKQRRVIDTEFNPTFHNLNSVQSSRPFEGAIRKFHTQPVREGPSAKSTQGGSSQVFPEATSPSASVSSSAPLRTIRYPVVPNAGNHALNVGPKNSNHALQDYQMQLMLLEQQNKKRLLMARQEKDSMTNPCSPPVNTSTNMQSAVPTAAPKPLNDTSREDCPGRAYTLPGGRNKRGSSSTVASSAVEAAGEPDTVARATASYQPPLANPDQTPCADQSDRKFQLMLLEQQNKKRLLMARQEQDSFLPRADNITRTAPSSQPPVPDLGEIQRASDPQVQLMLLEQQNRRRVLTARDAERESVERTSASNQPPVPEIGENTGDDVLADFDFDAFLETNVVKSWGDLNDFDFDAYNAQDPIEYEGLGRTTDLSESVSERGADSDNSDAQSWVDVAIEPTGSGGGGRSTGGTAVTGRTASMSVPTTPTRRSPSHSDSEWEFC